MFDNSLITGGTFTHIENRHISVKGGFERLQDAAAPGAFHNSGERFNPPKCHPNTRVAVLKKLMDWIFRQDRRTQNALMLWLYGPVGSGKSAIAQTFAEMCHAEGGLVASFFFLRNDPLRGTARGLVATISYQLCANLPQEVFHQVISAVERDPLIFSRSLEAQLTALVVKPVQGLVSTGFFEDPNAPRLIIIDGLDECDRVEVQSGILRTIFRLLQQKDLPFLFLIASRPETNISFFVESMSGSTIFARLALDNEYGSSKDIRLFLAESFMRIRLSHPIADYIPASWPGDEVLDVLVEKSSGQFIYASTVVKFVDSYFRRPPDRLDVILGLRPDAKTAPFAELDALYTQIMSRVESPSKTLQLIGLIVLQPPFDFRLRVPYSSKDLVSYLFLNPGDEYLFLQDLRSLIFTESSAGPHILHASFKDFLLDPTRAKDLYLDPAAKHTEYALLGYQHLYGDCPPRLHYSRVLGRIFYHSQRALATPELQKGILSFTFDFFLAFLDKAFERDKFTDWIPDYFSFLETLPWDHDQQFYKAQVKSLDNFLVEHLEIYDSDPFLSLLVAIYLNVAYMTDYPPPIPKASKVIDDHGLCLNDLSGFRESQRFQRLLVTCLSDPMRSGRHVFNAMKYAEVAIIALTYLSSHWSHSLPPVRSELDRLIRWKKPRRWREKWGKNSVLPSAMMRMKRNLRNDVYRDVIQARPGRFLPLINPKVYFNTCIYPWKKERHARGVFRFVLSHLPYILQHASGSEQLLDLAREFRFGPRAKTCRKSVRKANRAINEFLGNFSEVVNK